MTMQYFYSTIMLDAKPWTYWFLKLDSKLYFTKAELNHKLYNPEMRNECLLYQLRESLEEYENVFSSSVAILKNE